MMQGTEGEGGRGGGTKQAVPYGSFWCPEVITSTSITLMFAPPHPTGTPFTQHLRNINGTRVQIRGGWVGGTEDVVRRRKAGTKEALFVAGP